MAQAILQVAVVWRGQMIGYRLLDKRRRITLGPSKRATFATPPLGGRNKFVLLRPHRRGYVLHLAPGLDGELTLAGQATRLADVASMQVDLAPGDKAKLLFMDGSGVRVEIRWVEPPELVPRPRFNDPQMVQLTVGVGLVLGVLAALLNVMW